MKAKPMVALDYGQKYCGIAYSPNGINVFPVQVVKHNELEAVLGELIQGKEIEKIVLGLPLSTNGQENPLCAEIRQFARRLGRQFGLPIDYVDERFSSKSSVTDKSRHRIDDLAAAQILEYYLAQY